MRNARVGTVLLAFSLLFSVLNFTAATAAVPNAPGYSKSTLQVIVDNDYAAFMGNDSNVTRLFYQNNVAWMTQISTASSLDVFPQTGETYIYLAVMGGGGTEDWAGKINGQDVVNISGAQVATGRSPLGTAVVSAPYVKLESFITGFNSTDVANGVQNVLLSDLQTALTGVSWSSAVATGSNSTGNVPSYKTTGVCCQADATNAGMTGKGWNFPSNSLVVFRYPLSSLGLPVRAGDSQAIVDWDAPAAGDVPTGYIVQFKKSSDPDSAYTTFSTPTAPTTVETVVGLTNGIFYSFRVAATNVSGTGPWSAVREAMPTGPPPAPTSLIPLPKASSIQIAFTDPVSNGGSPLTNYEYTLDNGSSWIALSPADTTTPVTISGLIDGSSYNVKLRAVNALGSGTASSSFTLVPGMIARLSNLTLSNSPAKGVPTTLTVNLVLPGKITFLINNKRIAGCLKISSAGSAPNITATCIWEPTVMGRHLITVQESPTDNSYANGVLISQPLQVVKRTTLR
ncbi:MAG: fibronectin type III domain-containing protein [Candidatus Planktophila sp.]